MDDRKSSSIYYRMSSFVTRCCLLIIHRKNQPVNTATSDSSFPPFPWSTSDSSFQKNDKPSKMFEKRTSQRPLCLLGNQSCHFLREKKQVGKNPVDISLGTLGTISINPSASLDPRLPSHQPKPIWALKEMRGVKMEKLGWWDITPGCLGYTLGMKYYSVMWGL